MKEKGNLPIPGFISWQNRNCDICGFTFDKSELRKQRGFWVCKYDYDTGDKVSMPIRRIK